MTRDQMVERMIADDIQTIMHNHIGGGEFLYSVLSGEGWVPYNQLTDEQVLTEYQERVDVLDERGIEIPETT